MKLDKEKKFRFVKSRKVEKIKRNEKKLFEIHWNLICWWTFFLAIAITQCGRIINKKSSQHNSAAISVRINHRMRRNRFVCFTQCLRILRSECKNRNKQRRAINILIMCCDYIIVFHSLRLDLKRASRKSESGRERAKIAKRDSVDLWWPIKKASIKWHDLTFWLAWIDARLAAIKFR